jgi:hypothetical protein
MKALHITWIIICISTLGCVKFNIPRDSKPTIPVSTPSIIHIPVIGSKPLTIAPGSTTTNTQSPGHETTQVAALIMTIVIILCFGPYILLHIPLLLIYMRDKTMNIVNHIVRFIKNLNQPRD